jgi:hypothetical protein
MRILRVEPRAGVLWLVAGLAFLIRLAPMVRTGSLTAALGYDDGPLYAASACLLDGRLLYHDFVFRQPPGIAVLLMPFTALAGVVGDAVAMAAARVTMAALGAGNAVLIALHLRRYAPRWAVAAGIVYAVWRLPAGAERAVETEPVASLALLAGLLLIDNGRTAVTPARLAASGVLLGAASSVVLHAGRETAVIAGYLLAVRGWRAAAAWLSSAAAAAAAVLAPFVLADPGELVEQLGQGQLDRGRDIGVVQHLQRFSDLARLGRYELPMVVDIMLATCVLVSIIAVVLLAWWQPEAQLAVLLMCLTFAVVAVWPAYDVNRFAVAAPMLVIATAAAAHRLVPDPARSVVRHALVPLLGLLVATMAVTAVHDAVPRQPDPAVLRSFAARHRCVWFDTASLAIAADALTRLIDDGCPVPVDRYADLADLGVTAAFDDVWRARRTRVLQTRLIKELGIADAAVLPGENSDDAVGNSFLGDLARDAVRASFIPTGTYDNYTLWVRRV